MTTLREAAQMALDALDKLLDKLNADICDNSGIWDEYCDGGNAMQALRTALAQPEQEKLGEIVPADEEQLERIAKLVKPEPQGGYRWREGDVPPSMTYTAPPQREWKGLTDEERKEIIRQQKDFWGPVGWELECTKTIEAKLREKNT